MTGFGTATLTPKSGAKADGADPSLRVEVRSVNHRFLQLKVRVPSELSNFEQLVEERVRKRLDRGSVTVHVAMQESAALRKARLDQGLARSYHGLLTELAGDLGLEATHGVEQLAGLPGVIQAEVDDRRLAKIGSQLGKVVDGALDDLLEMRGREGDALEKDLRLNGDQVAKIVARIQKRMPGVVKRHQDNLRKRVGELMSGVRGGESQAVPANELAREIAMLADRLDVSEELSRLESHLDQLSKLLAKGGALGRQLDFLVQEFHREANTIGSKCNDAGVAHLVVDLKTRIERLREQVQNVE